MHLECGAACSLGGPHFVQKGSMPKKRVPCYKQLPPTARGPGIKEHASPTQEGRASFIYPPFENPSVSWVARPGPSPSPRLLSCLRGKTAQPGASAPEMLLLRPCPTAGGGYRVPGGEWFTSDSPPTPTPAGALFTLTWCSQPPRMPPARPCRAPQCGSSELLP